MTLPDDSSRKALPSGASRPSIVYLAQEPKPRSVHLSSPLGKPQATFSHYELPYSSVAVLGYTVRPPSPHPAKYCYRPALTSLRQQSYHPVATSVVVLLTLQSTASPLVSQLLQTSSRLPKPSCNSELVSRSSSSLKHLASFSTTSRLYAPVAARPPLKRSK